MKASGWIEEPQAFMDMMGIRMFLLFEEAKRVMDPNQGIGLEMGVVDLLGVKLLRLHVQVHITDMAGFTHRLNHVLVQYIDEGEDAFETLYPPDGTSGDLSKKAKDRVVSNLTRFIDGLRTIDIFVSSITYGRGLMRVLDDDEITGRIEKVNGECNGENLGIRWIPDSVYLMKDALRAASSMSFSSFGSAGSQI